MFLDRNSCKKFIINKDSIIRQSISAIETGKLKISLVLDNENKLIGTICDGDIRRAILNNISLDDSVSLIVQKNCVTSYAYAKKNEIYLLMQKNKISHIPIINENDEFVGLEIDNSLVTNENSGIIPNYALLMAGGRGERLKPLTNECPKPMIEVNGKPILEIILEQCIRSGIRKFFISVCYLADKIIKYFGDGSQWNVEINYLYEKKPLGTAGALNLLPKNLNQPIFLINGDILTKVDFKNLLDYHNSNKGEITICAGEHILKSPYGVINIDGINYIDMIEKPSFKNLINAGIYVINNAAIKTIKKNTYIDMPSLIKLEKSKNNNILVYPIHEYWIDIGRPDSLKQAIFDFDSGFYL